MPPRQSGGGRRGGGRAYTSPEALERERAEHEAELTAAYGSERFEGKPIKVKTGATGRKERLEFFYGGAGGPDGPGHGHVVCNDGENIIYWRQPSREGGRVLVDDRMSTEKLASHMF